MLTNSFPKDSVFPLFFLVIFLITFKIFNFLPLLPVLVPILVQFSHSVMSDSLWPHGLQHVRLPCPSPSPRVYSNSCPSSWWCHPIISSSVVPSSSHFNLSQHQGLFQWVFRTDFLWDGLLGSPCIQGTLKSLLQHHSSKASILLGLSFLYSPNSHIHTWLLEKP